MATLPVDSTLVPHSRRAVGLRVVLSWLRSAVWRRPAILGGTPNRSTRVLAPMLPALVLLGLSIAGLTDPPSDAAASRLHVPAAVPTPAHVPHTSRLHPVVLEAPHHA